MVRRIPKALLVVGWYALVAPVAPLFALAERQQEAVEPSRVVYVERVAEMVGSCAEAVRTADNHCWDRHRAQLRCRQDMRWSDCAAAVVEKDLTNDDDSLERAGSEAVADSWRADTAAWLTARGAELLSSLVRYIDADRDHDGLVDYRAIGDYDGDGSLEFQDIVQGFNDFQAYDELTGRFAFDRNGDGRDDRHRVTFVMLPGEYLGTFADALIVRLSNLVFQGKGRDNTRLHVDAPCTGTPGALDNNDQLQDFRHFITIVEGTGHLTFRDFSFDGGSPRSQLTRLGDDAPDHCDLNDVDHDGIGNGVDDSPGGSCAERWCPLDSHYFMFVGSDANGDGVDAGVNDLLLRNLSASNVDRTAVAGNQNGDRLRITRCHFSAIGEHSVWVDASRTEIDRNRFEFCGRAKGPCLVTAPHSGDITGLRVIDNEFENCPGECYGTEYGRYGISHVEIARNTMISDTHPNYKSPIRFTAEVYPTNEISDVVVRDNRIVLAASATEDAVMFKAWVPAPPFKRITVQRNQLTLSLIPFRFGRNGVVMQNAIDPFIVSNTIRVNGDADANQDNAIACVLCSGGLIRGNTVITAGPGVVGTFLASSSRVGIVSNDFRHLQTAGGSAPTVLLDASTGNTIEANRCRSGDAGVLLQRGSSSNTIRGNRFRQVQSCVDFGDPSDSNANNVVIGNHCIRPSVEPWAGSVELNLLQDNVVVP